MPLARPNLVSSHVRKARRSQLLRTATAPAAAAALSEAEEPAVLAEDDKVLAGIVWEDAASSAGKVFVKIN